MNRSPMTAAVAIAAMAFVLAVLVVASIYPAVDAATIAGIVSEDLTCTEDEVIAPVAPDQLGCVHIENVMP